MDDPLGGKHCQNQVQRPTTATPAYIKLAKHSVRELNPTCELQRLTSRLRAGERFSKQKSVLRESNPPSRIGSPGPLPLGQGHVNLQSAQWELNPHFRHGKAAGYRYIMGAKMHLYQIVKDQ